MLRMIGYVEIDFGISACSRPTTAVGYTLRTREQRAGLAGAVPKVA